MPGRGRSRGPATEQLAGFLVPILAGQIAPAPAQIAIELARRTDDHTRTGERVAIVGESDERLPAIRGFAEALDDWDAANRVGVTGVAVLGSPGP